MICNDTDELITFNQAGSRERPTQLGPHQNCDFHWCSSSLNELVEISVVRKGENWQCSAPLPINESIETYIVRSKSDESLFRILGLEL